MPRSEAPAEPSDGLYFLGSGKALLITKKRFVLSTPGGAMEGEVTSREGRLIFNSTIGKIECSFQVHDGHLWLGVLTSTRTGLLYDDSCESLFLPIVPARGSKPRLTWSALSGWWTLRGRGGKEIIAKHTRVDGERLFPQWPPSDETGELSEFRLRGDAVLTPWSDDAGPTGLLPARGVSGVGTWVNESGSRVVVSATWPSRPDTSTFQWMPDREGISRHVFRMEHFKAHEDSDTVVFWIPVGPDRAVRFMSGGCRGGTTALEYFRREKSIAIGLSGIAE